MLHSRPLSWALLGTAIGSCLSPCPASESPAPRVEFSSHAQQRLRTFGIAESVTLQQRALQAVQQGCADLPAGTTLTITFEDLAPSHPTRDQLAANPGLDVLRTHFLGGAELTATFRSGERVLSTLRHRYFPPSLQWGSASLDPWADANRAIEQFARQTRTACSRLALHRPPV